MNTKKAKESVEDFAVDNSDGGDEFEDIGISDNFNSNQNNFLTADIHIRGLVNFSNGADFSFPITLFVGGSIITGSTTSFEDFNNNLSATVKKLSENASRDVRSFLDKNFHELLVSKNKDFSFDKPPEFIHLKNCQIFTGSERINIGYWRGRIQSIDGFCIGLYK